jgi:hypothetical protein
MQEELKFKSSLGYIARACLLKKNKNKKVTEISITQSKLLP